MKHGYFGRKLGRNKDERRRLFMILTRSLIGAGRVRTTLAKAKAIQASVDKLITRAKSGRSGALNKISGELSDITAYKKLLEMSASRFGGRTSGYTRIVKLGTRLGDASEMVFLEFVDAAPVTEKAAPNAPKAAKGAKAIQEAEVVETEAVKPEKKAKQSKSPKTTK